MNFAFLQIFHNSSPEFVAFRKVAELVEKKLRKDMAVIVLGHIHASFYTNRDGERVFSQDIVVDKIDIVTAEGLVKMEPEAMQALPETAEEYTY